MVELCHGCGGCRTEHDTTEGVMCPTYRAADEEITRTQGHANMLRQAMSGDLPDDPTDDEFASEVLDLCIGCKGCARDCPSEVDTAKLKVEVLHERHLQEGAGFRDRLFANVNALAQLGSAFARVSNLVTELPGARTVLERVGGIAPDRTLPTFERESLRDWFEARGGTTVVAVDAERTAVLFPDTYTNFSHPAVGKASVRKLANQHLQTLQQAADGKRAQHENDFEQAITLRDRAMAKNVVWMLDYEDVNEAILWGHNGHLNRNENRASDGTSAPSMGYQLANHNRTNYYAIGFDFAGGSFQAVTETDDGYELK